MHNSDYAAVLVFSKASNFQIFEMSLLQKANSRQAYNGHFYEQVVDLSAKCKTEKFRSLLTFLQ